MIKLEIEPLLFLLKDGLVELGRESWQQIPLEGLDYDPAWDIYHDAEKSGRMRFLAIRSENDVLVGYVCMFYITPLHDKKKRNILIHDIYLKPEFRHGLRSAKKIFDKIREIAMYVKASRLSIAERDGKIGKVYERSGYKSSERVYVLGEEA